MQDAVGSRVGWAGEQHGQVASGTSEAQDGASALQAPGACKHEQCRCEGFGAKETHRDLTWRCEGSFGLFYAAQSVNMFLIATGCFPAIRRPRRNSRTSSPRSGSVQDFGSAARCAGIWPATMPNSCTGGMQS